jgi:hypothetical protein
VSGIKHCTGVTNTVTASGVGASSGIPVSTNDTAAVNIKSIDVECDATVNGEHNLVVTCDTSTHFITNAVQICNVGDLPILARIDASSLFLPPFGCTNWQNVVLPLNPGQCTNIDLCIDAFVCPSTCGQAFSNLVHVIAVVDTSKTNVCVYTRNPSNQVVQITASSRCEATVTCKPPNACRVTGGGRQDDPIVFPADVRYVTHGGQVGAPVGNKICTVTEDFYLGNPCIHGRWTHVRHQQGGLRGNFHARYYDTLDCACLDTNTTTQASGFGYNNLVYGPGHCD